MEKQEEIRGGLAREENDPKWLEAKRELSIQAYELAIWLNSYLTERFICVPEELPIDECLEETLTVLRHFHSQGVVIKGEENPRYPGWFKFEPLIKEK